MTSYETCTFYSLTKVILYSCMIFIKYFTDIIYALNSLHIFPLIANDNFSAL